MLIKIGDFSKKIGASIRTLRFYDKIDLFKPKEIDLFTSYRYYTEDQIIDYQLIVLLKEAGFSLEEIKKYWNNFNDVIMLEKKKQLMREIEDVRDKIRRVDYLRSNINKGKIILNGEEESIKHKKKTLLD